MKVFDGFADHRELMQQEIGQVTAIGFGEEKGAAVLSGRLLNHPRDREKLREAVPLLERAPIEQCARRAAVAIDERMLVRQHEMQRDGSNQRVNDGYSLGR